ncbi:MAG: M28 family peptidase [Bacteroidota bacterium]
MQRYFTIFFFLLCGKLALAQTAVNPTSKTAGLPAIRENVVSPVPFGKTITSGDLRAHLSIIAGDEMEGRETGTAGNDKAAAYIADHFRQLGLAPVVGSENPSYYQKVSFTWSMWNSIELNVKGEDYRHLWDFVSFPTRNSHLPAFDTREVVFLGYGIDDPKYSDYKNVNVKDKVVLVYRGEPMDADGNSYLSNSKEPSEWSTDWTKKAMAAKQNGVKALLIIEDRLKEIVSENRRFLVGPRVSMGDAASPADLYANQLMISTSIAKKIMGKRYKKVIKARDRIKANGSPRKVKLKTKLNLKQDKNERKLVGNNVLGFIEGSDPQLKDEVVVVTAHYDHLGKRGDDIYNGADDNGSGTSTVLEVAQALAEAKMKGAGPRRSVLTMLVTGEEKGLLGSQFYAENPIFPLANTVANVNVDMVGRVDAKYAENPNYIYVIGSDRLSTELHEINETANEQYTDLVLDYTYNADDDPNRYYYRSDHYNFAEKGIPAIFYFNGTHKDYHRTTDTVDKINFEKMEKVAQLVFYTTWELANRDKRIEVNVTGRN